MIPLLASLLLACAALSAQTPLIGDINLYGLRRLQPAKVLEVAGIKPGDPLPGSKGDLEDRLEDLPGVVLARVTAVCCEDARAMLFIGIEEKGSRHVAFRSEPSGAAMLPEDMVESWRRFLEAVEAAARRGAPAEDLTRGHSVMADPAARALQEGFAGLAAKNLPLLRDVLRNSAEADHRAIAAALIGYAPRKRDVIDDVQYALQDPDEAVRASAVRTMTAFAVLAAKDPAQQIRIAPTWFIELLHSVVLSDRLKAAEALVSLTEGNPAALEQVGERALASVVEMARWKSLRYAVPAYVLAGRIAGLPEPEIHSRWEKDDREAVIALALKKNRK